MKFWYDLKRGHVVLQFLFNTGFRIFKEGEHAMAQRRTKNGNYDVPQYSFVLKEWFAIIIALGTMLFSLGGWYFKMTAYEKEQTEIKTNLAENYVRKDVLGATLNDIQRQVMDQSTSLANMNLKIDALTVAVAAQRTVR